MHQFPLASFTSSPDTLCLTQCLNFTNTSVNLDANAGYTWYHDWTNHTPNALGLNSSYCYSTAGSFKTVVIDSSIYGCVDTSASKTIVVLPDLDAMFTIANDSLCGFTSTANFTSTSIPNTGVSYCWNFGDDVNGDSLVCHSTIANPSHLYTLNPPGGAGSVFRVRLKIQSRYGCLDSTTHNVSIFPNPVAGIAALPTVACDPLNVNFTDASNSLNGIINYHLNYGLAGSTAYNSPVPIGGVGGQFVYTPAGNYTATYTVTTGEGCTSNATIALVVNPNPVACPGPKDTICNGDLISIGCQPVPNLQYAWYRPIGPLYTPGNNVAQPVVHPALPTTYCLTVVNQFGCQDTGCVEIYVWPLVTLQAGPDSNICYGQPVTLWANAVGPTIGNYQWHNINSDYTSNQQNITVNPIHNDVYTVSILGPCNSDSIGLNINVYQPPPVTLEPSATIVAGQPYSILTVGNGTGLWFPDYAISCVNCLNPIVSPEVNTTYHVVLTDIHGCVDSATIFITVLCDRTNAVYVPNAFTPSKPGKNDHFYVQGTGVKEISYLRIYNRWGNLVFSTQHTQINKPELGWDGTFGGRELSSDVFMYQMQVECANGTLFPITGNFTLIR